MNRLLQVRHVSPSTSSSRSGLWSGLCPCVVLDGVKAMGAATPVAPRGSRALPAGLFQREKSSHSASNIYFVLLLWAIVLVQIWLNLWILQLLPIPVAGNTHTHMHAHAHTCCSLKEVVLYLVWVLKRLVVHFGLKGFAERSLCSWWSVLERLGREREGALLPGPIKGLAQFLLRMDTKVTSLKTPKHSKTVVLES